MDRRDFMKAGAATVLGSMVAPQMVFAAPQRQVYYNANVFTSDRHMPSATAFVVENDKFIYVGNDAEALKYGPGINMQGKRIIPGMVEAHSHPVMLAAFNSLNKIDIPYGHSKAQVLALLREEARKPEHAGFVFGMGFGPACGTDLLASELDAVVADRPVLLVAFDGHSGWGNSMVFQQAGITRDTPDPIPGGSYYARDKNGNPSGFMAETSTLYPVMRTLDMCPAPQLRAALLEQIAMFNYFGITTMFDAAMLNIREERALDLLTSLESSGALTMRYHAAMTYQGSWQMTPQDAVARLQKLDRTYSSDLLRVTTLKLFNDGTLEPTSAAMSADYCAPGKGRGGLVMSPEEALAAAKLAADAGYNIHTHAVGDLAISNALDVYEKLGSIKGTKTIAHVEVPHPKDVQRFIQMQDVFYETTLNWLEVLDTFTRDVLGPERYGWQYPLRTLNAHGVPLTFSYDSIGKDKYASPFFNSSFAVLRGTDKTGTIHPTPSEALSIADCIRGYTINGARQLGLENTIGSITTGKEADFVVLDRDVFHIPAEDIKNVHVEQTWLRGHCVYDHRTSNVQLAEDGALKRLF